MLSYLDKEETLQCLNEESVSWNYIGFNLLMETLTKDKFEDVDIYKIIKYFEKWTYNYYKQRNPAVFSIMDKHIKEMRDKYEYMQSFNTSTKVDIAKTLAMLMWFQNI